jgi:sorbitol-6-phosphate 2-dehydrogenase
MDYMNVSPLIRGLTFDGEKGLIVQFCDNYDGDCPVVDIPDEERLQETLETALFDADGKVHPVIKIPGTGFFFMGKDPDSLGTASVKQVSVQSRREDVVAGKITVVTGGAQGFGETLVRGLFSAGALVVIADMNLEGAQSLAAELNRGAGETRALAVAVNVADEGSVAQMTSGVVKALGGIDLFISNAGVLKAGGVREFSLKDFRFVTDVNYIGYFLCVKHAAPVMALQNAAAGGRYFSDIIQINSKSGLEGSNRNGAYAGGKFGGIGLTQSFALELVADNIKVNSICPGNFFDGPLWSDPDRGLFVQYLNTGKVPGATTMEDVRRFYEAKVPMGRGCRGDDVLKSVFYLVEQKYETGQALPVTGGQVMLK